MYNRINLLRPLLDQLLSQQERVIVAIDGPCTSGKTTLAAALEKEYDCNLFHMDDFFLRPEQRTPQRLAEAGGNVDYERFLADVLLPLQQGTPFSYQPFHCKTQELLPPVAVTPKPLTIIEGSYSLHPSFGNPYHLRVLLTVDPDIQRQRILDRPSFLHQRFFDQWIPMENRYLEVFQISQQCDIIL